MAQRELQARTFRFALDIISLAAQLPKDPVTSVVLRQLVRSATSVGANYRPACRAKSRADFVAKMGIVEEEADESMYWMDLLLRAGIGPQGAIWALYAEANELISMTVASLRTARHNHSR